MTIAEDNPRWARDYVDAAHADGEAGKVIGSQGTILTYASEPPPSIAVAFYHDV